MRRYGEAILTQGQRVRLIDGQTVTFTRWADAEAVGKWIWYQTDTGLLNTCPVSQVSLMRTEIG